MSSNHYLENLDSRYAVKTEAEILYPRVSAAEFFGRQAVQLANTAAAAAATNSPPSPAAAPRLCDLHHADLGRREPGPGFCVSFGRVAGRLLAIADVPGQCDHRQRGAGRDIHHVAGDHHIGGETTAAAQAGKQTVCL